MRNVRILFLREMRSYFVSPVNRAIRSSAWAATELPEGIAPS